VSRFLSEKETNELAFKTAKSSEQSNNFQDALELFHFCGRHADVIRILIKQLRRVMTFSHRDPERNAIIHMSTNVYNAYKIDGIWAQRQNELDTQIFEVECQLITFFDMYVAGKYLDALQLMMGLDLLPFEQSHFDAQVAAFSQLDDNIRVNFPEILLKTMECLCRIYEEQKPLVGLPAALRGDQSPEVLIQKLRSFAKILLRFAGLTATQFQMPGDTYGKLARLELSIA